MTFSCFLMRHALSVHNIQKQLWKSSSKEESYKASPQYAQLKYNKKFIDPSLSSDCQLSTLMSHFGLSKVKLIICSPLRRCLQTCAQILKNNKECKVIIEPYLNSRLSSAWSIGSDIRIIKKDFPHFDFSAFDGKQSTWMSTFLEDPKQFQRLIKQTDRSCNDIMLHLLAGNRGEKHEAFYSRVGELKKRLKKIVEEYGPNGDLLIISHACVLNALVAKYRNKNGKLKGKQKFEHSKPKRVELRQFLESLGMPLDTLKPKL